MISVERFIETEFHPNSPNKIKAMQVANLHKIIGRNVIKVRGDGKCFIRSLVHALILQRKSDVCFNILSRFVIDEYVEELFVTIEKKILNDDCALINHICTNIILHIDNNWDYEIDKSYYINENNIDGPVRDAVMRLLGISKVTIYSLIIPSTDKEQNIKILQPSKPLLCEGVTPWSLELLCVHGFCHYNLLN